MQSFVKRITASLPLKIRLQYRFSLYEFSSREFLPFCYIFLYLNFIRAIWFAYNKKFTWFKKGEKRRIVFMREFLNRMEWKKSEWKIKLWLFGTRKGFEIGFPSKLLFFLIVIKRKALIRTLRICIINRKRAKNAVPMKKRKSKCGKKYLRNLLYVLSHFYVYFLYSPEQEIS